MAQNITLQAKMLLKVILSWVQHVSFHMYRIQCGEQLSNHIFSSLSILLILIFYKRIHHFWFESFLSCWTVFSAVAFSSQFEIKLWIEPVWRVISMLPNRDQLEGKFTWNLITITANLNYSRTYSVF